MIIVTSELSNNRPSLNTQFKLSRRFNMTKITFAALMAVIISTHAFAAQSNRYGSPSSTGPTYPHVFSGGQDQGTDPSGLVRMDLLRDPPYGGGQ
jgi:hypothetical protein